MRTCSVCGNRTDEGEFCGVCGAYLGWAEQGGPTPVDPDAPTDPVLPAVAGPGSAETAVAQPVAVQPAKPVEPRPETHDPVPVPASDGPPCSACGTPNPPDRSFCSRCAAPLAQAPRPSRLPWWRRVRWPRANGSFTMVWRRLRVLLVLLVLLVGGVLLYPVGRSIVRDVFDKISDTVPVGPVHTVASAEVPGHPSAAAVDKLTNVYWGAPEPGAWVQFDFERPFRLLTVVVTPGASTRPEIFRAQARPTSVDLVVTDSHGRHHTVHAPLADQPGKKHITTRISDVVRVRAVIREATGLTEGRHIAVGEIEFFGRS